MRQSDRKLRFIVLGDTHFCTKAIRGNTEKQYPLAELPDHARYAGMVKNILEPMFKRIKSLAPDFVISTGDFVEGQMSGSQDKTYAEMKEGWSFMKSLGAPCFIAKGTHEGSGAHIGAKAYRDIVLPGMSELSGKIINNEYFRVDRGDCAFFLLDYLAYNVRGKQDKWLENGLRSASANGKTICITAHPPLYNWGRHFFNEPDFTNRILELCRKYPVRVYLCGHTHNQTLSYHETRKERCLIQIMGSSVGCEHMDLAPLNEFHFIADFSQKDHFVWGLVEDSSPGFHIIEIKKNGRINIEWNSFKGDKASACFEKNALLEVKPPIYRQVKQNLTEKDALIIKYAALYIFGIYCSPDNTYVYFNGVDIGKLPKNSTYAARRYIQLPPEALKTIGCKNIIGIIFPEDNEFVIGSISLEVILWDNRLVRSKVGPEIFVRGKHWKKFPKPRKMKNIGDRKKIDMELSFE